MEAISFDTSGAVVITTRRDLLANGVPAEPDERTVRWPDLSPFVQGCMKAATEELDRLLRADPGNYLDGGEAVSYIGPEEHHRFDAWDPSALALILRDCEKGVGIETFVWGREYNANDAGGRCFWSDRQAGRWPDFPPQQPYLSDEGRVCLRDAA